MAENYAYLCVLIFYNYIEAFNRVILIKVTFQSLKIFKYFHILHKDFLKKFMGLMANWLFLIFFSKTFF